MAPDSSSAARFVHLHYMGLICGVLFLVFSFLLRARVRWHSVVPQAVLVLIMVVLTAYSQFSIIPAHGHGPGLSRRQCCFASGIESGTRAV